MTWPLIVSLLVGIAIAETLDDFAGRVSLYDKLGWNVAMQNTVVYITILVAAILAYPIVQPLVG